MWADALVDGHGLDCGRDQAPIAGHPMRRSSIRPFLRRTRRQRLGLPIRWIEPLDNATVACWVSWILHPGLPVILTTLRGWPRAWDWIDVDCVEAGSALEAAWRQAAAGHGCPLRAQSGHAPAFCQRTGSFAEFLSRRAPGTSASAVADCCGNCSPIPRCSCACSSAAQMPSFIDSVSAD